MTNTTNFPNPRVSPPSSPRADCRSTVSSANRGGFYDRSPSRLSLRCAITYIFGASGLFWVCVGALVWGEVVS